jgi:hypothetical protein
MVMEKSNPLTSSVAKSILAELALEERLILLVVDIK